MGWKGFGIPVQGQFDVFPGGYCYGPAYLPLPSSSARVCFILPDVCILGSSGRFDVYYSTPGALKVQGLAARKVTAGSPLNRCKLSAGSGEAGQRAWRMALGGSPAWGSPLPAPPPPPHPQFGRNSSVGCWKQ